MASAAFLSREVLPRPGRGTESGGSCVRGAGHGQVKAVRTRAPRTGGSNVAPSPLHPSFEMPPKAPRKSAELGNGFARFREVT